MSRVSDLTGLVHTLRGKVEFEVSEEGREIDVLEHLLRRATAEEYRARMGGVDTSGLLGRFDEGITVETGDMASASDLLESIGTIPGLGRIVAAVAGDSDDDYRESPALAAVAVEFVLEGLYLTRKLRKDIVGGRAVFGKA